MRTGAERTHMHSTGLSDDERKGRMANASSSLEPLTVTIATAKQISGSSSQQHETGIGEEVGPLYPWQIRGGEMELELDGGQGYIDNGYVKRVQEDGHADDDHHHRAPSSYMPFLLLPTLFCGE